MIVVLLLLSLVGAPLTAGAVQAEHSVVVSADPENWTPHALDGEVLAIAQVGNRVVVGGTFTQIRAAANETPINRPYIFAFNATTGALDNNFAPVVNNVVEALDVGPDGQSVFVGGRFNSVNGLTRRNVVKLNISNGQVVTAFSANTNSRVNDLKVRGATVYIGGNFSQVGGQPRSLLAALDATTGAVSPNVDMTFSEPYAGRDGVGVLSVRKLDVTPDGSKLVTIGNFGAVNGQDRDQVAVFDLGTPAQLAAWHTARFPQNVCSQSFDSYVRDVDISPDGAYMVIVTTGAYRGTATLCDTASRWNLTATGSNLQPAWVNYTGGDTLWGVGITGEAVYIGGHQRWVNNPFAGDRAGAGAVPREGLAALDPANGMPLTWDPGRDRGVGVFDIVGTDAGLWIGSDTDRVGRWEYHGRLAMFPVRGGAPMPPAEPGSLPGTIARAQGTGLALRSFDGANAGAPTTVGGGLDWSLARGAFMLSGQLYYGMSDGRLYQRSFDGSAYGPATALNLYGLTSTQFPIASLLGAFYEPVTKRLYYAVAGQSNLYYRYFEPESGIVGAQTFTATGSVAGIAWSNVRGMHLADDGRLYLGYSDGVLRRVNFVNGLPSGSVATVPGAGPGWNTRALFLLSGAPTPPPNNPPTASFTHHCAGLRCTFDASGSSDPDGSIAAVGWTFGDGATASGATVTHEYTQAGSYPVQLTVTDDEGATATASADVTVDEAAAGIAFRGIAADAGNKVQYNVTVPAGVQAQDALLLFASYGRTDTDPSPTGVTGWTKVGTEVSGNLRTTLWSKVAGAADAGGNVRLQADSTVKADVALVAYSGTDPSAPIGAVASAAETVYQAEHTTPTVNTTGGAFAVSYWSDRSSATADWDPPSGPTIRREAFGAGGGRVSALLGDQGPLPAGTYGGLTAVADNAHNNATMWTVALRSR